MGQQGRQEGVSDADHRLTRVKQTPALRKALLAVGASSIVVLALLPLVTSFKHIGGFDWDYFVSYHEALRRVIVDYHQFPWWNPWIAGGVPLFGNPQIGLVSVETPFTLLFGTIFGLKLAAIAYFLAGYWGMYWLLKKLGTRLGIRLLLSYVWIFSTFVTFHCFAGHYTFLMYLLSPWLFFLALRLRDGWRWAVLLGLFIGFFANSDMHWMVVEAFIILGLWVAVQLVVVKDKKQLLMRALVAGGVGIVLFLPRLYFAYQYVSEFPSQATFLFQPVANWHTVARAFLQPLQKPTSLGANGLAWWEYSSYIGISTVLLFVIAAAYFCRDAYQKKRVNLGVVFLAGFIICFVIGLGPFTRFSPYHVLQHIYALC